MRLALLLALGALAGAAEPRWAMQYLHDQDESRFLINDLKFASAARGAACGTLIEKERERPSALVTSDGGRTWSRVPTKETCLSLFFLNENLGWMVAPGGIWQTEETGRNWHKISGINGVLRLWFLDEKRGFAVGMRKSIWSTDDGGRRWKRVEVEEKTKTNPSHTAYTFITFASPRLGMILGASQPPRATFSHLPDWMDPERAQKRRQWPALALALETRDGGATWSPTAISMFGQITRLHIAGDLRGLALVEFHDAFQWPSEVYRTDARTGMSARVFREKNRAVTDVLLAGGAGYLAAIEPPGTLRDLPIPGKLKVLTSSDFSRWAEMPVDYRAEGRRAVFAKAGDGDLWVATDAGMILKLVRP